MTKTVTQRVAQLCGLRSAGVTCSHIHIYIGPLHLNSHGPTGSPVRTRDSREAQRDEEKRL